MRIDHIAYGVKNINETVEFFQEAFGYKIADEFEISFGDNSTAKCITLNPPEKIRCMPYKFVHVGVWDLHLAPEIYVIDGSSDSVVGKWVAERNGIGGIHHVAYQVTSVKDTMAEWKEKGYAEFTTDDPLTHPGISRCYTKPCKLTGIVYEFIERDKNLHLR
jgi:catechol 2,3-dioxygenase-like lactoylglutathione lyase family enzyme